jgi:hypothetical protein
VEKEGEKTRDDGWVVVRHLEGLDGAHVHAIPRLVRHHHHAVVRLHVRRVGIHTL